MKRFCTLAVVLAALTMLVAPVMAQDLTVVHGKSVRNDTSAPMRDIAPLVTAPRTGLNVEIPVMTRPGTEGRMPVDGRPDALIQDSFRPTPGAGPTPAVGASFEGLDEDDNDNLLGTRIVPPDTNGTVGRDHNGDVAYLQWINLVWGVFNEDGTVRGGPFAGNSFWAGAGGNCEFNNNGDPVVHYDDNAGRWMVSQFAINQGTQCVAVSETADPLGAYHRYEFVITPGGANDYPKMGVWDDGTTGSAGQSAYTFTSRDFGGAGGSFSNAAGVMERDAMLNGDPAQFIKFSFPCVGGNCREGTLPAHLDGAAVPANTCPTWFTYTDTQFDDDPAGLDGARVDQLCVDWATIGNSTLNELAFVDGGEFDRGLGNGFSDCVTPVMGGEPLDCLAIFTMHPAQVRNHGSHCSVLINTTVDAGGSRAGIRWGELRSDNCSDGWAFHQEGTYAPADDVDRWMGSIAMDGDGNIALGYSATSASLFPSVRYTSRMAGDPLGEMSGGEESCHEGTGAQISSANRWGDYSRMGVDPQDDCTFWFTTEYYETTSSFDFKTRICSFKFADCGDGGGGDFTLTGVTPGTAGVLNTFATINGTPNVKANFVGGSAAGSTAVNVPNCGVINMDVGGNIKRLGFDTANGSGEHDLMRLIPAGQAGNTAFIQAIDQATCTKSNVVEVTW